MGRRDFTLGVVLGSLVIAGLSTPIGAGILAASRSKRSSKVLVSIAGTKWQVPVKSEGEPFLNLLADYFQIEYLEGPWQDEAIGKLLVFVKDSQGTVLVGEDLEVVINQSFTPNVGLDLLVARPDYFYDLDQSGSLADRYGFFQPH